MNFDCTFSDGDTQQRFNNAGVCMISTINHCIEGVREEKFADVEVMVDYGMLFWHSVGL